MSISEKISIIPILSIINIDKTTKKLIGDFYKTNGPNPKWHLNNINDSILIYAIYGEEIVGCVRFHEKNNIIFSLLVHEEYRNLGIATKLLKKLIHIITKMYNKERFHLWLADMDLIELYMPLGFYLTDEVNNENERLMSYNKHLEFKR